MGISEAMTRAIPDEIVRVTTAIRAVDETDPGLSAVPNRAKSAGACEGVCAQVAGSFFATFNLQSSERGCSFSAPKQMFVT